MKNNPNNNLYLDANFLVAYFVDNHPDSNTSKIKMAEFLEQKKILLISCLTLDETLCKIRLTLEDQVSQEERRPYREFYGDFKTILESALDHPSMKIIQFENNLIEGVRHVLENIKNYNLKPRDAFHLSLMQDLNVDSIVTKDKDFTGIPGVNPISF